MQSLSVRLIICTLQEYSKISETLDTIDIEVLSEVKIFE